MYLAYVVLYVHDLDASYSFWIEQMGMIEKGQKQAGDFKIVQVGFPDQESNLELVPLALMKDNPHGLDLATPSIAFRVDDVPATHELIRARGVTTSDITEMGGVVSFAFSDNENRWFAVLPM
jgi:lactoylglutathione lyase